MLQVARLAPRLLGEASSRVAEYLRGELQEDGGARNRSGRSDLYYTVFLLEGLLALQSERPIEEVTPYLRRFGDGETLDFVHLACLARAWASLGGGAPPGATRHRIAERIEAHRSLDGGYGASPGAARGTVYNAFLALGAYQDLGLELPDRQRLGAGLGALRAADGGWANGEDLRVGQTPATAAAVALHRHLGLPIPGDVGDWLLRQLHERGGFLAMPGAPLPDLLSTATALHALAGLDVPFDELREPCLDFLDSVWTGRGFCGHWADDGPDCEYTWYALLALGHLSL